MKTWVLLPMAGLLTISVAASGCTTYSDKPAVSPVTEYQSDRGAVSPTVTERFKQDTVTGRVYAIGPSHLSIQEYNGETLRVGINDRTKMDRVLIGEQVKAYVSEDGYASTVQRIAE